MPLREIVGASELDINRSLCEPHRGGGAETFLAAVSTGDAAAFNVIEGCDGRVTAIYLMRNSDKLRHLATAPALR